MTDDTTPAAPVATQSTRPRKAAGVTGQAVAVVGVALCLVLTVGVFAARGWAVNQVDAMAATIDDGLAKGAPLLSTASSQAAEIRVRVGRVGEIAQTVASTTTPAPELASALSERISAVSERYLPLRATYADARAQAVSTLDRLQTIDRIVPGISIPQGPVDTLSAVDASIQRLDGTMLTVIGANAAAQSVRGAAEIIATEAPQVEAALDDATAALDAAAVRLEAARAEVADTFATINLVITIVTLVLVVLLLYLALLHFVLFRSAAGLRASR